MPLPDLSARRAQLPLSTARLGLGFAEKQRHSAYWGHISADFRSRSQTELKHRFQVGWAKFRKHRHILTNKHVSIALTLKCFDTVLTPTVLFGLHVLPLTLSQIHALDAVQRRMLRSVVGWVRVANEDWHSTMSRMKHRLTAALHIHPVDTWSRQLAQRQYNFAFQMLRIPNWAAAVVKLHRKQLAGKFCFTTTWRAGCDRQLTGLHGRTPSLSFVTGTVTWPTTSCGGLG